jgi:hypothetical protein
MVDGDGGGGGRQAISDASRNQLLSSSDPAHLLSTDKGHPLIREAAVILSSLTRNKGSDENMVEGRQLPPLSPPIHMVEYTNTILCLYPLRACQPSSKHRV